MVLMGVVTAAAAILVMSSEYKTDLFDEMLPRSVVFHSYPVNGFDNTSAAMFNSVG